MFKKTVELLAPAGNFDCLKAAINNGANAVYLGGKNFSARAFANNFDNNELVEALKYAHLRNVKVYVAINTLLSDFEFDNAMKQVDFYYKNNVDALLIQDLGLYYVIKNKYPDFELHCSTQMHIHNIEGIKVAKKLGFKRVVVARESNLNFIRQACKEDIEIETFVHGAICVSYSGQCLMSSSSKNRSANKGMCAQCCRLKYELLDEEYTHIDANTDYLLSPKDMFLIDDIPELIDAGVSSFKIEGRMKSPAYVGYVTRMYRKAIDCYYQNISFELSDNDLDNLKVLFNRNFTNDYLYSRFNLFTQKTPNHLGIEIGETVGYKNGKLYIKLSKTLNQFDGIRINEYGQIVNLLYKNDLLVSHGDIGEIVGIDVDYNLQGKVFKTLDSVLESSISKYEFNRLPLELNIIIIPNNKVKIICNTYDFTYTSDIIPQSSINKPLTDDNIIKQFSKLNETVYYLDKVSINTENAFLPVSILNEIRRNFINELNEYRLSVFSRKPIVSQVEYTNMNPYTGNEQLIETSGYINNDYAINYVINNTNNYANVDKSVVCEIGGLLHPYNEKIAYYTLNCFNSYCYEFLLKLGFERIIVSSELNNEQLEKLINNFKIRNGISIKPYVFIKGNRPLMYIKAKPFLNYPNAKYLSDGKTTYKLLFNNDITEIVEEYNNDININEHMLIYKRLS